MDDISILEELGLQEVSRKTHIETRFLKYMVNRDFSRLNRINTLGFVKILKREYNLDLKDWTDEFELYWSEHGYKKDSAYEHNGSLFAQDQQEAPKSKSGLIFLIILILLGAVFYFLDGMSYVKTLQEKFIKKTDTNTSYTKASVVEETKAQLETIENQENQDSIQESENQEASDENVSQEENQNQEVGGVIQEIDEVEEVEDKNESVLIIKQSTVESEPNDENKSQASNDEKVSDEKADNEKAQEEKAVAEEATLIPRRKIWVGIVNLDTKKRKQYLTKKSIKIDLNAPQAIITGHGDFTLEDSNGKKETYSSKKTKYYYVDGGTITKIDKKEFISYNGGKPW